MKVAVGIDIGGTKVAVALINENGEIVSRSQSPSQTASAESLYQGVVQLVDKVLNDNDLRIQDTYGIGVGLPGKVDVENGVAIFQNNIPWANFPIVERLKETYGDIPVKIDNHVWIRNGINRNRSHQHRQQYNLTRGRVLRRNWVCQSTLL